MPKTRKVVKKGKKKRKPKKPSKKWEKYKVEDGKISRSAKFCPRCGPGVFLAESKNRWFCGRCHYTEFKGREEIKKKEEEKGKKEEKKEVKK